MGVLYEIAHDSDMQYIIMAGTNNAEFKDEPRQLFRIDGEPIIARTIRLLRECGVENIAISSNNPIFEQFQVPVLHHENHKWMDAFYPTAEPTCYIFGDVLFSKQAIEKIVSTDTDDIEFFASAPPFTKQYIKKWAEPFAFKVQDQEHFQEAIRVCNGYAEQGLFKRPPIAWELWQVIKGTRLNEIRYDTYCVINDYTCDVDTIADGNKLQARIIECRNT